MGIMGPPVPNMGGTIIPGAGRRGSEGRETGPTEDSAEDIPGRLGRPGSGGRDSGPEGLTKGKRVLGKVDQSEQSIYLAGVRTAAPGRESRLGAEPRPLEVTEMLKNID